MVGNVLFYYPTLFMRGKREIHNGSLLIHKKDKKREKGKKKTKTNNKIKQREQQIVQLIPMH